jgi:hypothetical protein
MHSEENEGGGEDRKKRIETQARALLILEKALELERTRRFSLEKSINSLQEEFMNSQAQLAACQTSLMLERAKCCALQKFLEASGSSSGTGNTHHAAFDRHGIKEAVLHFIGQHEWIYIAGISRAWRAAYMRVTRGKFSTSPAAALHSVSRLELACNMGLDVGTTHMQDTGHNVSLSLSYWAGRWANLDVILRAKELGLTWDCWIGYGAAFEGRLALLQQLHYDFECPLGPHIARQAAYAPTPAVLSWIREVVRAGSWDEDDMRWMIANSSVRGSIEVGRWLREYGAAWHNGTLLWAALNGHKQYLLWARSRGCPWGCEQQFCSKAKASPIFAWLHTDLELQSWGAFPCTCSNQQPS